MRIRKDGDPKNTALLYSLIQRFFALLLPAFLLSIIFNSCGDPRPSSFRAVSDELPDIVDYNFHIKPLLSDRCFTCHGPDANKRAADLRLDQEEDAYAEATSPKSKAAFVLKPGNLRKSEVFHRLISEEADYVMPPPESNLKLSIKEKALIAKWIQQGATYEPHWSFSMPQKAALPTVAPHQRPLQPLDHFIVEKLEKAGLNLAQEASREELLRRWSLDLTGLPPSPEDIQAFVADPDPNAAEKQIDRLLASPHFGERMASDWLDLARYADSHGYQDDGLRNVWPWRDWVIKAYNENLPHDQFILWQLAGDLLDNPTHDQILATCFNRHHPQTQEGGVVDEEYRVEYVADRTNTFGKAFLGLTMECARCHDHKYDPISQEDYYALFGYFNNNKEAGIVPYNGEAAPTLLLPSEEAKAKLAAYAESRKALEGELVAENFVDEFQKWYKQKRQLPTKPNYKLIADFHFEKDIVAPHKQVNLDRQDKVTRKDSAIAYINKVGNKPDAALWGDIDKRPKEVAGKNGNGLEFLGDAGIRFSRDFDFDRHQPFSVSLWIKLLKGGESGPIFGKTNGDFEGYRGWLCKLNKDGTLSFQLNHVWPANCIDIKTKDSIPLDQWTHIAMTYDGSSKADGVHFYIDGKRPDSEVLNDHLYKSLLHGANETNWSNLPFFLGMELRQTIQHIVMDELKVYKRQLAEIEVQQLSQLTDAPTEDHWLEYYLLAGKNRRYQKTLQKLTELRKEENLLLTNQPEVMIMQERPKRQPTYILDRGAYDAPGREVTLATPAALPAMPKDYPANRLGLAKWLVDGSNPLTARVSVNRFWMMLFGKGLVETQEDFGNQGKLPSHPELLDWLAVDFVESGWDVKKLMKQLLLSATYRQSSLASEASREADPGNLLYSRFPAHRLSAETIRDKALAASKLLVPKIGGPSVYPYQPDGLWKALATRNATEYRQQSGDSLYRRSLYTIWKRSSPPPSMVNFDAPDRYNCVVRRQKTATPLQSLVLMNDPQFVEAAKVLAQHSLQDAGPETEAQIRFAFLALINRSPSGREMDLLRNLYQESLNDFLEKPDQATALLKTGEFAVDASLADKQLAALTIVNSTLMNYDEFVMKR